MMTMMLLMIIGMRERPGAPIIGPAGRLAGQHQPRSCHHDRHNRRQCYHQPGSFHHHRYHQLVIISINLTL